MKVASGGTIRKLTTRFLKAHAARNVITVAAIALTAMMFTSVFTIGGNMLAAIRHMLGEVNQGENWISMIIDVLTDPSAIAVLSLVLVLILLSGYLIIYSIFAISVTSDIHFYGLLKTLGTTGRQIRKIVRRQALFLSAAGIPLGLLAGYIAGVRLVPVVLGVTTLADEIPAATANPLVFVFASAFSLITVFIGCRKPGKIAARVSPVEAVRYSGADAAGGRRAKRTRKVTPLSMAWTNVTREKRKLAVIVLSLSLSLILLNSTVSVVQGFDLDAYVSDSIISDFIVADRSLLRSIGTSETSYGIVPPGFANELASRGITEFAEVYYQEDMMHPLPEQAYENFSRIAEAMRSELERDYKVALPSLESCLTERRLPTQIYGVGRGAFENFYRDSEGFYYDYGKLSSGNYAAVVAPFPGRGQVYDVGDEIILTSANGESRSFEVIASIEEYPYSISARHFMVPGQEVVLADNVFLDFFGGQNAMTALFNAADGKLAETESWLAAYIAQTNPALDYVSRETLKADFAGLQATYLTLGGVMSFILALTGILNFINAIATSVIARRRELAVLQSVGMTGKQLRHMLFFEGACYTALTAFLTLTAGLGLSILIVQMIAGGIWFFNQSFTALPSVLFLIPLLLICACAPLICYAKLTHESLVTRLGGN
ncbi:MAG: ABC transporter permease [Clostridiales Family XIII bacterium]|jgi:putative ABC transport system permease protein|nr:ABC transporter permease [Clostridiales Family XIII bacterium]